MTQHSKCIYCSEAEAKEREAERVIANHSKSHGHAFFASGDAGQLLREREAPTVVLEQAFERTVRKRNLFVELFIDARRGNRLVHVEEWRPTGRVWVGPTIEGRLIGVLVPSEDDGGNRGIVIIDPSPNGGAVRLSQDRPPTDDALLESIALAVRNATGLETWPPGQCGCSVRSGD